MIALVADKRPDIAALCRHYGVRRLEVFGSAATGDFDPATSDLDFIIYFADGDDENLSDRFFGIIRDLEALFGREVDVLVNPKLTNPYFRASINASREVLYDTETQRRRAAV